MSVKTVRLDPEHEKLLDRIRRRTGWTATDALKRGLSLLEQHLSEKPAKSAFEVYSDIDLGPGGYAAGPASESRETARRVIQQKHER
jgi:hypothetical protein